MRRCTSRASSRSGSTLDLATVTVQEHFRVASPEAFGIDRASAAVPACGAVLMYLRENQAASVALVTSLRAHRAGEYVGLDAHTMRNLELFTAGRDLRRDGSLLATLDLTSTSMGARLLRRRLGQPLRRHRRDRRAARRGRVLPRERAAPRAPAPSCCARCPTSSASSAASSPDRRSRASSSALRRGLELIPRLRATSSQTGGR